MVAAIDLTYVVVDSENTHHIIEAWMQSGAWPAGTRGTVDPLMDFTPDGLKFDGAQRVRRGELLLLDLKLPSSSKRWRASARVVRTEILSAAERKESDCCQRIAVALERVEHGLPGALVNLLEHLQDVEIERRATRKARMA